MKRLKPSNTASRIEEVRRAGEDPEQALVPIRCVDDLSNAIERLAAHVTAHAENRLGFVDHDDEAFVASGLHHFEHALEVRHRIFARDVSFDAGRLFLGCAYVLATGEPRHQRAGFADFASLLEPEDFAQHAAEILRCFAARQRLDVFLDSLLHLLIEVARGLIGTTIDQCVLYLGNPAIDDVAERTTRTRAGSKLLHDLAVHIVELVEVKIIVRDDNEARGETLRLCVMQCQARHERLAAAITTAQELEDAFARPSEIKQAPNLSALTLNTNGERFEAPLGNNA